jgi:hypothetical protein
MGVRDDLLSSIYLDALGLHSLLYCTSHLPMEITEDDVNDEGDHQQGH